MWNWFSLLVEIFPVLPLIRHGFAVPPSPDGEGFGAVEMGVPGDTHVVGVGMPTPYAHV